uniref:Enhancer of polycomb-like protein n=1 Tax=Lotharella oceanica TaxID=641309 RepID=A0A7S2TJD0_9EUKA|mmetsp:Transcript_15127/g.28789  ORF Transcript_15127/g.28789 Transcript_15127/m.28789 type:complete len:535 (+) Transcript_15127:95-1699(+)
MSRTIRPRNLDVSKKLQIRRVQDVTFKDGDETISVTHAARGTVQKVVESKKTFIPTPKVQIVSETTGVKKEFKQPVNYIKFANCTGAKVITEHDQYDLLQDDIEWMHKYNAENVKDRYPLNEDLLEALIDMYEKQAWLNSKHNSGQDQGNKADPRKDYPAERAVQDAEALGVRAKAAEKVYEHWVEKRLRLDKALMRKFQQPPPHDDTNPHVAFRLRQPEGRRASARFSRRQNDSQGLDKMKCLRRDFERLLEILDNVKEREIMKRDMHLLDTEIADKKLEATLPAKIKDDAEVKPYMVSKVPKCAIRKETATRDHKKRPSRPYSKPKNRIFRRDRIPLPSVQVAEASDDDILSETDDSDKEFYENIENMLAETKMEADGLSPRKLLSDTGFPGPHWLADWGEILETELPTFEELRRARGIKRKRPEELPESKGQAANGAANGVTNGAINGTQIGAGAAVDKNLESRTPEVPAHQSFLRHRGRFCGRIGRGGRLFLMVKCTGKRRNQLEDDGDEFDLVDVEDDNLILHDDDGAF